MCYYPAGQNIITTYLLSRVCKEWCCLGPQWSNNLTQGSRITHSWLGEVKHYQLERGVNKREVHSLSPPLFPLSRFREDRGRHTSSALNGGSYFATSRSKYMFGSSAELYEAVRKICMGCASDSLWFQTGGNCNPSCVMSVSSEWLIITAKFLAGRYPPILPQLLKKYEYSLSNFDPSTKKKLKIKNGSLCRYNCVVSPLFS